jgi:argininosuccinate lyase
MIDKTNFPDSVYKETVLAPLFEGAKAHFVEAVRSINQAHLIMLRETQIISKTDAASIATALTEIDENLDVSSLQYTGEFEDYFFFL